MPQMMKRRLDMYGTIIKACEKNYATGRVQYRVLHCSKNKSILFSKVLFSSRNIGQILLVTNKPYRIGNLINPRKALGIPKKGKS
jgi:hypothetical protein